MTKKKNVSIKAILSFAVMYAVGGAVGFLLGTYVDHIDSPGLAFVWSLVMLLGVALFTLVQMAIHEAGHLLGGLATGYRFSSYRIGSLMLLREGDRLVLRRLSIAGTGGQCLMAPPPLVDGKIPYVLYNLGGSLANLAAALIFGIIWFAARGHVWLAPLAMLGCLLGLIFALFNGIPLHAGPVDNDGYNALSLGQHPAALRAFRAQMQINAALAGGTRLRDMPDEWFAVEEDALHNAMTAALAVFACNRLMDAHKFAEADARMADLTRTDNAVTGLHRGLLTCDRIWCALMAGDRDRAASLDTAEQRKFMRSMKDFPGVLRTAHAQALLGEDDAARADQHEARFAQIARCYPYPADIASEHELIDLAKQHANFC